MRETTAHPDTDQPVTPGDTVRYTTPYTTQQGGVYTHGIVSEVVARAGGPDSPPCNVGTLPFNPRSNTVYLKDASQGARGVPETVDFHVDTLELVEKADGGYKNLDEAVDAYRHATGRIDGFLTNADVLIPRCPSARWEQLQPTIDELEAAGSDALHDAAFIVDEVNGPCISLTVGHGHPEGDLLVGTARRMGFEIDDRNERADRTTYYLRDPEVDTAYERQFSGTNN